MQRVNKISFFLSSLLLLGLSHYSSYAEDVPLNNYPTQARVEYVFECMSKYGGENYNTMYGCVCAIDEIAKRIPYDNYVRTQTLDSILKVPGERSAQYRDIKGGREAISEFKTFTAERESYCGLKKPAPVAATPANTQTTKASQASAQP